MFIDHIKKQHEEIKKALGELKEDVHSAEDLSRNALWVALKIGHLRGILAMHLKFEDDYLYPCLLESKIDEAKVVARKVVTEMGALADKFNAYQKKYILNPNAIKQQAEEFKHDTLHIIESILRRIEAEEKDVYSLTMSTSCFRPEVKK
jgi:gas vesicle protein